MLWAVRKVTGREAGEEALPPPKPSLSPSEPPTCSGRAAGPRAWPRLRELNCGCCQKDVRFCRDLLVSALPWTVPSEAGGLHCSRARLRTC